VSIIDNLKNQDEISSTIKLEFSFKMFFF
jgi:hypothetical protein